MFWILKFSHLEIRSGVCFIEYTCVCIHTEYIKESASLWASTQTLQDFVSPSINSTQKEFIDHAHHFGLGFSSDLIAFQAKNYKQIFCFSKINKAY